MCGKTRDLRRQLRKAIIDHVSDSFLDTTVPLLVLVEAAKNGPEKEIKEYAAIFREHTTYTEGVMRHVNFLTGTGHNPEMKCILCD
uniref:Uncharacterized protein n=1 Tax=Phocoena sinus TaxID=42100 RepID=A0A8C9CYN1_PHOSS